MTAIAFQKGADSLGSRGSGGTSWEDAPRFKRCLGYVRDAEQDEDDDNAWDDAEREERSVLR